MAGYSIRSLADLSNEAKGFITQSIQGVVTKIWPNTFRIFGKVMALIGFGLEMRRAWLLRQVFASTADDVWLARHGFELSIAQQGAKRAMGNILVPAAAGMAIPAGLRFQAGNGFTYTTIVDETASGSPAVLPVLADDAGAAGNLAAGFTLNLVDGQDAPVGLGTTATVATGGLAGGADAEQLETFRARVLTRKRKPPQGGATSDYETWVKEALGADTVHNVFVDSFQNDSRSVWVCFTVTDQPNGIPTEEQVAIVQAYVDDPVRRPVTARAFATGPIPLAVPILVGALNPDTLDVRDAVEAELEALFIDRALPGKPSADSSLSKSWIEEAISRATGEDRHDLNSPTGNLSFSAGYLPVLGTVNYTD